MKYLKASQDEYQNEVIRTEIANRLHSKIGIIEQEIINDLYGGKIDNSLQIEIFDEIHRLIDKFVREEIGDKKIESFKRDNGRFRPEIFGHILPQFINYVSNYMRNGHEKYQQQQKRLLERFKSLFYK